MGGWIGGQSCSKDLINKIKIEGSRQKWFKIWETNKGFELLSTKILYLS